MRQTVGPDMGVKASGGARSYEDAVAFIEAGATRIGTFCWCSHHGRRGSSWRLLS